MKQKNQQPTTEPTSEQPGQKPPSRNRTRQTTQDAQTPPNPKTTEPKDATTKRSTHQLNPNQQHGGNQPTDEQNQNQPRTKHET